MNTSEFYAAGLVEKGEEIAGLFKATLGFLVLTNKRFLLVQKLLFSECFDVLYSVGWNDVSSVSTSGLLLNRVNITMRTKDAITKLQFGCWGAKQIAERMAVCKKNYVEPTQQTD